MTEILYCAGQCRHNFGPGVRKEHGWFRHAFTLIELLVVIAMRQPSSGVDFGNCFLTLDLSG
jgi:hypothetical protein